MWIEISTCCFYPIFIVYYPLAVLYYMRVRILGIPVKNKTRGYVEHYVGSHF